MSKKEIRQSLMDVITEFGELEGWTKSNMEKITLRDEDEFYMYVEDHADLKFYMYKTFHQIFEDYISFRFYNDPIPALTENKSYMDERAKEIEEEAKNFFNFGGIGK